MPDNGDYIADYLSGGLSPEEMKEFEARLATDEDLNKEYQLLSKGMDYLKARAMLEEIESDPDLPALDKEYAAYYSEKKRAASISKFQRAVWRTLQAAAFVGALLIIRSILFAVTTVKLYDRFYDPLSSETLSEQVVMDSTNTAVLAGMDCYFLEDYVGAIKHLVEVPEGSFYLGLSQLELEQYDEARKSLLTFQEANPDYPDVNWYLGLTYLRLDEVDHALESLNKLPSTNNPYSDRAEELIRKIEKVKATSKENP